MYDILDEILDGQIDMFAGLPCSEMVSKEYAVSITPLEIIYECNQRTVCQA